MHKLLTPCLVPAMLIAPLTAQAQATPSTPTVPAGQVRDPPSPENRPRPVLQGRLANGLRYAIVPRRTREPGVGLLVRVEGGFLAERRPGERGLAHLIEHLVFHSPTRSAPKELRRFRAVGFPLSLPEPAGGTTSWRESDYFLVSRTTRPADIDALLGLFREVGGELIFRADVVDEQRASVMREMADKKPGNLINARYAASVTPGSPVDVIDGQNSDDVPTASVDAIRALYHRLYRPETMTIVIAGDVDARRIEALIRKRFGGWRGVGPAPERVAVPLFRPERVAPVSHSALPEGRRVAMLTVATRLPPPARTPRRQAEAMLRDMVAMRAVNDRLAVGQPAAPPGKIGSFIETGEQGPHRLIMLWDNFEPGQWRPALAGLKSAACALGREGLSEAEWAKAKQQVLHELERRASEMANLEWARQVSDALTAGRPLVAPDEMLSLARALLPRMEARAMNDWWRRQWRAAPEHVRVEAPELAELQDPAAAIRETAGAACEVRGSRT